MNPLVSSLEDCLREVATRVAELEDQGQGTQVLGPVAGRSGAEDVEIEIDRVCDEIIDGWLRETGLTIDVYSEHGTRRIGGGEAKPRFFVASDPFDGSGLFKRGLRAEWWSVLSVFSADGVSPVFGGAVDILRKEMYIADNDRVGFTSLETGRATSVSPSTKRTIDNEAVIAAYLIDPTYLSDWTRQAGGLLNRLVERFPGARIWPNGGACIYPWLARGLVHAYVTFNEPRSEIDPGLSFAAAAGYPVFSIGEGGTLEPYHFIPGHQTGRVPFFVAACTADLAENIVREIEQSA